MAGPRSRNEISKTGWESVKDLYFLTADLDSEERDKILERFGTDQDTRAEILELLGFREPAEKYFRQVQEDIQSIVRVEPLIRSGETLGGRFAIIRFLARGGMGEVYEAEDLELSGRLALKVMRTGAVDRSSGLPRFREEIRLARGVNSPYVCRVFDVARHTDSTRDLVFFTMELLSGETLADRVRRDGPLPIPQARDFIRQMATGLAAAHEAGILHRDFKSSNVMLCQSAGRCRVAITDFGLSRQMGGEQPCSVLIDGITPAYVAPEQLERKMETQRTDVYSFGVVLFEMMTGELPFRGGYALETARKRLHESPPSPRSLRPEIPRSWDRAILRCLERDPARRYSSVLEAARDMKVVEVPQRPTWRSRRSILAVALAGSAVSWVLFIRKLTTPPAEQRPLLAVMDFEAPSDLAYLAGGLANHISDEMTDVPGLKVLSRRMIHSEGPLSSTALERKFGVTHVLSGTLVQQGGDYRMAIQLAGSGGAVLWARTRELRRQELEGSSRVLVREVIHALHIELSPAQATRVGKSLTGDGVAYENYLLGRYYLSRRDEASLTRSVEHLETAVGRDPRFAEAHSALAASLAHLASVDGIYRPALVDRSDQEAHRGLALDASLAEAHLVLARNAHFWNWDWSGAETHYRRVLEMKPMLASAHYGFATMLYLLGRFPEALAEIDHAFELDPLDRSLQIARGTILLGMNRVDDAIEQQNRVVSADPSFSTGWVEISSAYAEKGLFGEAIEAAQRAVALEGRKSFTLVPLGYAYARSGRNGEANFIREELERSFRARKAGPSQIAAVYAGSRNIEKTFEWLQLGVSVRDVELIAIKVSPQWSLLRGDPRYRMLLAQIHLE